MSNYLMKYKGIYELRTEIDESILDFARENDGTLVDNDIYINCKHGRIYNYGNGILEAWVGDINGTSKANKFHKILSTCGNIEYNAKKKTYTYSDEGESLIIWDSIIVGQGEGSFRFHNKHIDIIAKQMGALTQGKNSSPFAKKYLPIKEYNIPKKDLSRYKKVVKPLIEENKLYLINQIYKRLAVELGIELSEETRKAQLGAKEYYHSIGKWDSLIELLKNEGKKG